MREVVIVSAARTPIGSFGGSLKNVPTRKLGAIVIKSAIERAGIKPEMVEEVIMGAVLQGGLGQNVARQMTLDAGLPIETPAMTINKVCGSGLRAVELAAQIIKAGDADIIGIGRGLWADPEMPRKILEGRPEDIVRCTRCASCEDPVTQPRICRVNPSLGREKEMDIRALVKERLDRGKVDMYIYFDNADSDKDVAINRAVVMQYYSQLQEIARQLGIEPDGNGLLQAIMRFPETLQVKVEELDEEEWLALRAGIEKALEEINRFRLQEGEALMKDILRRVGLIEELAAQVPQFEGQRIVAIRQRLQEKINEWTEVKNVDQNRLEQEIIYYLEKLDITEEKVRLANHCKYFRETVDKEDAPGRKIGFIAQEMGREINTLGSKANDHDIQKLVVRMKDELEKIKEQSLNIL